MHHSLFFLVCPGHFQERKHLFYYLNVCITVVLSSFTDMWEQPGFWHSPPLSASQCKDTGLCGPISYNSPFEEHGKK